jgi:hypothetical protein
MFSPRRWIANVVEAAEDIANKQLQEQRWMSPDLQAWERPEELINVLFDDSVFEGFLEEYASSFSTEQRRIAFDLRNTMNSYCDATSSYLDPKEVLADPRWEAIRQKASAFVHVFKGNWPIQST